MTENPFSDEVFISSTAGGVMPVTTVNGKTIAGGKPGKITILLQTRYWQAHDEDRWTTQVDYPAEFKDFSKSA